ncbi:MAG: hypothetical protein QM571_06055 [Micrococcaceae bacterium]
MAEVIKRKIWSFYSGKWQGINLHRKGKAFLSSLEVGRYKQCRPSSCCPISTSNMHWGSAKLEEMFHKVGASTKIRELAKGYFEEASKKHGPYKLNIAKNKVNNKINISLSNADKLVEGFKIKVQATGSIKFADKSAQEFLSSLKQNEISINKIDYGAGRIETVVDNLPGALKWFEPEKPNVQRLFLTSSTTKAKAVLDTKPVAPIYLKLTTQTVSKEISANSKLRDRIQLRPTNKNMIWPSNLATNQPVKIKVKSVLWGPFDRKPELSDVYPDAKKKIGETLTEVDGFKDFITEDTEVKGAGYYVWTAEILPKTAIPDYAKNLFKVPKSKFGESSETTLVKWSINVRTLISEKNISVGETNSDTLEVSGLKAAKTEEKITLKIYGPFPKLPEQRIKVPKIAQEYIEKKIPIDNGTIKADFQEKINKAGCYTVAVHYPGNEITNSFTSEFGIPEESFCVHKVDTEEKLNHEFKHHETYEEGNSSELQKEIFQNEVGKVEDHLTQKKQENRVEKINNKQEVDESKALQTLPELAKTGISSKRYRNFSGIAFLLIGIGSLIQVLRRI